MGRMSGKIAVITGGGGGIGSAAAAALAREGASVTVTDISIDHARKVAQETGGEALSLDVANEDQWQETVRAVMARHGKIDVLVNAAGIEGNIAAGTPENTTFEEWRKVLSVNLDGVFLGCKTVLPVMKRNRSGSIVNISSIVSYFGTPNSTSYGASKAAVQQLTKSVALHGARDGGKIRCNSVHPGVIRTRMLANIYRELARIGGISPEEAEQISLRAIPFGELGTAEQVADTILFLACDESAYVTGSEFQVDGGWHLLEAK